MERRQAARRGPPASHPREIDLRDGDRGTALILYLDTSALLKIYFEEDGSSVVEEHLGRADLVATSWIAYVEARAAFARRLSPEQRRQARASLDVDWPRYVKIDVTETLLREAAVAAETYHLRGYDAVHLASARTLRDRRRDPITFGSWDRELDEAAARDGFILLTRPRGR